MNNKEREALKAQVNKELNEEGLVEYDNVVLSVNSAEQARNKAEMGRQDNLEKKRLESIERFSEIVNIIDDKIDKATNNGNELINFKTYEIGIWYNEILVDKIIKHYTDKGYCLYCSQHTNDVKISWQETSWIKDLWMRVDDVWKELLIYASILFVPSVIFVIVMLLIG